MRRLPIDRTTLIFLVFVLIIVGLFGYNYFFQRQPAQTFTIAADPLAEDWLRAAAEQFNASTPVVAGGRVAVNIVTVPDYDVWGGNPGWGTGDHPIGWMPSSNLVLDYVPPSLPFATINTATARTPLVWGGFSDRVATVTLDGQRPFEWEAVQQTVTAGRWSELGASGGNINMAIANVQRSTAGLGALLSAVANFQGTDTPDTDVLRDTAFQDWYGPIVDAMLNSQRTSTGGDPAATMAARGRTVADFGLLPEVQWLQNIGPLRQAGITFSYPAYQLVLDFPLLVWDDASTTEMERGTVAAFGEYLLRDEAQQLAVSYGLRPATSEPTIDARPFADAIAEGIQIEPDYGLALQAPSRNGASALVRSLE